MVNFIRIFFLRFAFFGFLFLITGCQSSARFSVMTYNLRLDIAVDGDNAWTHRKDLLVGQLLTVRPDIFGVQEARPNQMKYIGQAMENYGFIGHGRDGGNKGEYSAIFYNRTVFSVEMYNTFWLSDTPTEKSMGWDAAFPRICTYGLFTNIKTGKKIWVVNTHLDHMGIQAREKGMALILAKINTLNSHGFPVILMGDFNAEPDDTLIRELSVQMLDAKSISKNTPLGPNATFNAFQPIEEATRRIDYIMLSPTSGFTVKNYVTVYEENAPQYPSDHFPVVAYLKLK